jgi:hypothetical protein
VRIRKPWQVIKFNKRNLNLRTGIGLSYASKGGGPVLRDQSRWYKLTHINGFWINLPNSHYWILFWRQGG